MHPSSVIRPILVAALVAAPLSLDAQTSTSPGSLPAAQSALERSPNDLEAVIWHARFVGYSDYARAVELYTEALRRWPDEPWLLRHRGHRYISLRRFEEARADLQRAFELTSGKPDMVEQDGQPNPSGIPTSTLQSNIRYHLALAQFLTGQYAPAAAIWAEDARVAKNLDQRVAATFWWVIALARGGDLAGARAALAPIQADWEIIENGSYHRLLLWMKGDLSEQALRASMTTPLERQTIGNGIAQWKLSTGDRAGAMAARAEVLSTGPSAAFGYIAAERLSGR